MPSGIGAVDLMIGFPQGGRGQDLRLPARRPRGPTTPAPRSSPPATCSRTFPTGSTRATTGSPSPSREMDTWGVAVGMVGVGADTTARALKEHPGPVRRQHRDRPQRHHRRGPPHPRRQGGARHQGRHHLPCRVQPAGAGERPPLLPDLPDLHRPRHPDRVERRRSPARASRRPARTSCTSTRSATTSPSCAS